MKLCNCGKQYLKKWQAKLALKGILKSNSKNPWRDEMSVYKCDECENYHISSKPTEYSPSNIKGKSYFDIQKEKWGNFLQNHSKNNAVINKSNKKYST